MADHIAQCILASVESTALELKMLGPSVAPLEKLRGLYRYHMLMVTVHPGEIQRIITHAKSSIKEIDGVQWIVDIDAQDMV